MARKRIRNARRHWKWLVVLLLAGLTLIGCPEPQKKQEEVKAPEKSPQYRLLTSGDQKTLFEFIKSTLTDFEITADSTLDIRQDSDRILPEYEPAVNGVFLPEDGSGDSFLRTAADAACITLAEAQGILSDQDRTEMLRFVRNAFLLEEIALYLRHQYKIHDYTNPYNEGEIAHAFSRALIHHFAGEDPDITALAAKLTEFYEKLLSRVPKDFPGTSEDPGARKEWFNKKYVELRSTNRTSYVLYRMLRQSAHFKKEAGSPFADFVKENIVKPGGRAAANIKIADSSLKVYTLYDGKRRVLQRIGHAFKFRGLSGVAVDPENRVFFSDFRNIQQITDRGGRDIVDGSQGLFSPTGFRTDSVGRFYFVDRDMIRIVDLPKRGASNIRLSGKLEGSVGENLHGIAPVAITPNGNVLIVNNSSRSRTLYMLDGDGSVVDSVALRGAAGGIAYHGGNIYVTNTTHHTVDLVDFSRGVATVAGVRDYPGHGDGKGFEVFFNSPTGICVNKEGDILVADTYNHAIRKINANGDVSTITGLRRGKADGSVKQAGIHCPVSIAVSDSGAIYVAELASERVLAISSAKAEPEDKKIPAAETSGLDSPDKEVAELSREIERSPIGYRLFDTYVRRGIRYRELGDHDKSIADLEAAIDIAPHKLSAHVEAGITMEAADQVDDAINTYTLAVNMKKDLVPIEQFRDHDFLRALIQRGLAQAALSNFTAALEDLSNVIKIRKSAVEIFKEPDLPADKVAQIWLSRGKIYLDSGDAQKAIADFDQALTHKQNLVKAHYYRGLAYKAAGKFEDAIKDLTKAAALESSFADPHFALGLIYQSNLVDLQKAIQHFRTYLALNGSEKADAEARVDEIKTKMTRTATSDEAFWEEVIEDREGRRWILRHYADGRTQKFPVREDREK